PATVHPCALRPRLQSQDSVSGVTLLLRRGAKVKVCLRTSGCGVSIGELSLATAVALLLPVRTGCMFGRHFVPSILGAPGCLTARHKSHPRWARPKELLAALISARAIPLNAAFDAAAI